MQHIWICIIDGCLIRSGPVHAGDTINLLQEKLFKTFPHMGPESLKVVREDGKVFDMEMGFSNPTHDDKTAHTILAAVGVVEGFVGVKIHRNVTAEEVLEMEAGSFSGKIDDNMDFGVYDFTGEQLASIEDMILHLGPESAPEPLYQPPSEDSGRRVRSRRRYRRTRGGRRQSPNAGSQNQPQTEGAVAAGAPSTEPNSEFTENVDEEGSEDLEKMDGASSEFEESERTEPGDDFADESESDESQQGDNKDGSPNH
jgi:hypothetical protein